MLEPSGGPPPIHPRVDRKNGMLYFWATPTIIALALIYKLPKEKRPH
jgi:hypothetical protein